MMAVGIKLSLYPALNVDATAHIDLFESLALPRAFKNWQTKSARIGIKIIVWF